VTFSEPQLIRIIKFAGILVLVNLAMPVLAQQNEDIWKSESPDHNFFAATRRTPSSDFIWKQDLDGFRFVIFSIQSDQGMKSYFTYDITSRIPSEIRWSNDSKFIVFTTTSSGGHSPWHYETYVFSLADRRMVSIDNNIGPVVESKFKLTAPHTAVFQVGDYEHSTSRSVDLSSFFKAKK